MPEKAQARRMKLKPQKIRVMPDPPLIGTACGVLPSTSFSFSFQVRKKLILVENKLEVGQA
jgi:hypothetical protein